MICLLYLKNSKVIIKNIIDVIKSDHIGNLKLIFNIIYTTNIRNVNKSKLFSGIPKKIIKGYSLFLVNKKSLKMYLN